VWTDTRNSKNDIYGAASNNGPWTNIPIVNTEDSQSSPAIATESEGSILHLVWIDDRPGDNDIYYAQTGSGLSGSPLTEINIIYDPSGSDQLCPTIAVSGNTGNNLQVFVCWVDERNADDDLYFAELGSGSETNVFISDEGISSGQSEPAIHIDGDGQPYLVWTNDGTDIYYTGSTFIDPDVLASGNVSTSSTVTVGTPFNSINSVDDVSVVVPAGVYPCDIKITISRIKNPQQVTAEIISGPYAFGPSGIEFFQPVTIIIPYAAHASGDSVKVYPDTLITDVEVIVVSPTLHAMRFKTTQLTQFFVGR
jgi:hypothetical protein